MNKTTHNAQSLDSTDSYRATEMWLTFMGQPASHVEEPTAGVTQLYTEQLIARIRVGAGPATQGTVIAMLRAAVEDDHRTMVMFSPTGYNSAAIEFAAVRGLALFTLTPEGAVVGETVAAQMLIPDGEYEPPFATSAEEDENDPFLASIAAEPEPEPEPEDPFDGGTGEWKTCPRCKASQHSELVQCASCGADLTARFTVLSHGAPAPLLQSSPGGTNSGPPGLRCRSCGSHDIEMVHR